ncbi:hypothetical protein SAMN05444339_10835 [Loktanella atrilutea]|uniref:Lipoprotein n=1 Tax=Loktanella atrilutea TaxID=366533 RepID=A0A1M5CP19_LOKAT|nr:hypothetical protein [Loktanella atrilutea]SHF56505.1 hypothetical protein SAMN05444339_10835 [Loktanella atrilutea]
MMMKPLIALALVALGACSTSFGDGPRAIGAAATDAFGDTPFTDGVAISAITRDPNPLRTIQTYKFVPCQQGRAVCGDSSTGRPGILTLEDGQYVVRGAYPGKTFYFDRNGDGFMQVGQVLTPLAWN